MTTAIDDQIVSNDDIVIGEDIRGNVLTQRTLSERLVSLAVTDIKTTAMKVMLNGLQIFCQMAFVATNE